MLSMNLGEIKREISKLIFAWQEYIRKEILSNQNVRKFTFSLAGGVTVFFIIGSLFWWVRGSVYAQAGAVLNPRYSYPFPVVFPWIASGVVVSAFVGFARANYSLFKRGFDFVVAGLALIVLSPLFLIIALLIKVDSQGPVFFVQGRIGKGATIFKIWKFRTMRNNAELETGAVWAEDRDPRVTRVGSFLRNSHLDELPQLINVFKGEMSLIGPRPERPEFLETISSYVPHFPQRLHIKPGITGLAQVRYKYGASIKDAARKLKYDLLYIKRMCWLLDFQIVLWTLGRVLSGEGSR